MKAGIGLDAWKLPIFERHLSQAGYSFTYAGELMAGMVLLTVQTENKNALEIVVRAANTEAARSKHGKH